MAGRGGEGCRWDVPGNWTVDPPGGREHPDYVFAALRILMHAGLIVGGDWVENRFVVSNEPVHIQLARMRKLFDAVPQSRPILHGDVADFVATPLGKQVYEQHPPLFDEIVHAIELEWNAADKRYGRQRPTAHAS